MPVKIEAHTVPHFKAPIHIGGRVCGRKIFDLLILHSGHSMGHTKVYMHFQYVLY